MLFYKSENQDISKDLWVYLIVFSFIAINSILIANGFFYFSLIPVLLILIWLGFTSLDKLIYCIIFFVPLSVPLTWFKGKLTVDLYLPTEPLLAGIVLLFILKFLKGEKIDRMIIIHPVSIAVFFNILWIFITSLTSTMPVVSFKFLIARIWFIVSFYLLATQIFRLKKNFRTYLWAYLIPLTIVIFYVIIRLSGYGLTNQQASNFVVVPFFNDHTSYGAVLALLIPPLIGLFINYRKINNGLKFLFLLYIGIYITALVFSYTRAAWVSLAGAFILWVFIKLRIRWQIIVFGLVIIVGLFFSLRTELMIKLEQNKQSSSGKLTQHIQSISNIRNDVSNLERLNRWNCAIRMFKERPIFGWGPGTYMFQYAPFQKPWEKTRISTNAGIVGNAHSEYLGPLSEQGIFGFLSILSIICLTIWTGLKVYFKTDNRNLKIMVLSVLLGLCTYYIHGIMNNFLDTDKASALFWGFTAMLVVSDVYHSESLTKDHGQ